MSERISYDDKVALNAKEEIAPINKVEDSDLNQIKAVVNDHADEIENLQANQVDGVERYDTVADLPATGVSTTSYKVTNDPNPSLNGYYSWNGAGYDIDAKLVENVIEEINNSVGVSGKAVSFKLSAENISEDILVDDFYIKNSTVLETGSITYKTKKYKVEEGDTYRVLGSVKGVDVLAIGLFSSDVVSGANLVSTVLDQQFNVDTPIDFEFVIPSGVTYLMTSVEDSNALSVRRIIKDRKSIEDISSDLYIDVDLPKTIINEDNYIVYSTSIKTPTVGFNINKYQVVEGDTYRVYGTASGNDIMTIGLFGDKVINASNVVEKVLDINNLSSTQVDLSVVIPSGVTYLVTSNNEGTSELKVDRITAYKENALNNEINLNGSDLLLSSIEAGTYMNALNGDALPVAGFSIKKYKIKEGVNYKVSGIISGNGIGVINYYSSDIVNESNLIENVLSVFDNINDTEVYNISTAPIGAEFLMVGQRDPEDINATIPSFDEVSEYNTNKELDSLNKKVLGSDNGNDVVLQMTKGDSELSKIHQQNYIDCKKQLNNRGVVYKNITSDFVVPVLFGSVDIDLSNVTGISTFDSYKIVIGTKEKHDLYRVTNISVNTVTANLIESNLGLEGLTVSASTEIEGFKVYLEEDVKRYNSNVFMSDLVLPDKYHLTTEGFNLLGDVYSESIKKNLPTVAKVYLFGDSYADSPYNLASRIESNLGVTSSGYTYGFAGQRIEYINDQFNTFMTSYTPISGDYFIFIMGTNNLADIHRNTSDALEMVLNLSYSDLWLQISENISNKLTLGNFTIGTGFGNTDFY